MKNADLIFTGSMERRTQRCLMIFHHRHYPSWFSRGAVENSGRVWSGWVGFGGGSVGSGGFGVDGWDQEGLGWMGGIWGWMGGVRRVWGGWVGPGGFGVDEWDQEGLGWMDGISPRWVRALCRILASSPSRSPAPVPIPQEPGQGWIHPGIISPDGKCEVSAPATFPWLGGSSDPTSSSSGGSKQGSPRMSFLPGRIPERSLSDP